MSRLLSGLPGPIALWQGTLSACAGVDIAIANADADADADSSAGHACIVWHIKMNDPLSLRLGVNSPTLD